MAPYRTIHVRWQEVTYGLSVQTLNNNLNVINSVPTFAYFCPIPIAFTNVAVPSLIPQTVACIQDLYLDTIHTGSLVLTRLRTTVIDVQFTVHTRKPCIATVAHITEIESEGCDFNINFSQTEKQRYGIGLKLETNIYPCEWYGKEVQFGASVSLREKFAHCYYISVLKKLLPSHKTENQVPGPYNSSCLSTKFPCVSQSNPELHRISLSP